MDEPDPLPPAREAKAGRSAGSRAPLPPTDAARDPRLAVRAQCRRCSYDLRGLDPKGRCPECGLAIGFSNPDSILGRTGIGTGLGDRLRVGLDEVLIGTQRSVDAWEPIADGSRWVASGLWGLAPLLLGGPLHPVFGGLGLVALAMQAVSQVLGVRDIAAGLRLAGMIEGDVGRKLASAMFLTRVHAVVASLAGLMALAPCCIGSAVQLPAGYQLVAMTCLLPTLIASLWSMRQLGNAVTETTAIVAAHRFLRRDDLLFVSLSAGMLAAWGATSLLHMSGGVAYDRFFVLACMVSVLASLAFIVPLVALGKLFLRLGVALPQLPLFNPAAERAARGPQRPLAPSNARTVRGERQIIEADEPIPLADEPPPPDGPKP